MTGPFNDLLKNLQSHFFREMPNLEIKTEGQLLKDKMSVLNSTSDSDVPSLIIVLEELEDLAHKV